jgi:hypothetical protein
MTWNDKVVIADVVVNDLMRETVASNVISWPTSAITELSAIAKICKYKGLKEGHHFIPMAMEVHGTLGVIWITSSWSVFVFPQEVIYPCLFAFNFSGSVLVLLSSVL